MAEQLCLGLSLIPIALAIGRGAEILQPMAITVIGGLLTATITTLLVIPVIYSLLTKEQNHNPGIGNDVI